MTRRAGALWQVPARRRGATFGPTIWA